MNWGWWLGEAAVAALWCGAARADYPDAGIAKVCKEQRATLREISAKMGDEAMAACEKKEARADLRQLGLEPRNASQRHRYRTAAAYRSSQTGSGLHLPRVIGVAPFPPVIVRVSVDVGANFGEVLEQQSLVRY